LPNTEKINSKNPTDGKAGHFLGRDETFCKDRVLSTVPEIPQEYPGIPGFVVARS
jgi:hypothetical protein